jgi:hypothetical protein
VVYQAQVANQAQVAFQERLVLVVHQEYQEQADIRENPELAVKVVLVAHQAFQAQAVNLELAE